MMDDDDDNVEEIERDDVEEIEPEEDQTLWMSCSPGRQSSSEEEDSVEQGDDAKKIISVCYYVCSFM